jgi:nitrogen fixation/metabolism regulation signal transduction histidine kinase
MTTRHVYSSAGMENEDWYEKTLALKGQIYAFRDERNPDYLFFSHLLSSTQVADPRYNEKIGVVLYAMPMLRVNRLLAESKFSDQSCVVLLYRDTVMACTDEAFFPAGQRLEGILELPSPGTVGKTRLNSTLYSVTQAHFQRDWQCVLLAPEKAIVYQQAPFYLLALMLFMLVAVAMALSLILSRQVIRPIVRLSGIMEQAKDAEHMPPAQETGPGDEITVLYQSYSAMRQRIQSLSRKALDEQKKHRDSELKTMQAQINPHFIYNTLDSISCSALMEGNDSIVTMVASLINILKYSINFSRTTVPLREEINYLEDYICIQQIRFADGFSFEYDIPERYMSVLVSPIILQPLVENSLFHAGNQDGGLRIRLYCEEKDGCLLIHVTDNGSAGNADRINGFLTEDGDPDGHGIGIRNVYRRITLLFGGRGGLHYAQLPDGGLDAVVRIPLQGVLAEPRNEEDEGTGGTD